ncbi:TetR/AcrR family transcriptional regulator [Myxococcota bacterium]|nr:TetR/AcrR family transcriptional regulator [Myxococcota bacterium]
MARTYRSPLRESQALATRARILDTAWVLLRTTRAADLTFELLAAEAQVSVRTVYRHFPRADDLFLALSDRLFEKLGAEGDDPQHPTRYTREDGEALIRRQFAAMQADPAVFRAFFAVPTRSRIRGPHPLEYMFASTLAPLPPEERRMALGLLDLLGSPYAWDVLHANWGNDADQSSRAALAGIRAILDMLARDPRALAPRLPEDEP